MRCIKKAILLLSGFDTFITLIPGHYSLLKKSADDKKCMTNFPACQELKTLNCGMWLDPGTQILMNTSDHLLTEMTLLINFGKNVERTSSQKKE